MPTMNSNLIMLVLEEEVEVVEERQLLVHS
jgi:hypothetical protein